MPLIPPTVSLPLDRPPRVMHMAGHALHGIYGEERYQVRVWCLNLYRGRGELEMLGHVFPLAPGYASVTPADAPLRYRYRGHAVLTWAHFLPTPRGRASTFVPVRDLGAAFDVVQSSLAAAAAAHRDEPARADAALWDALWRVAAPPPTSAPPDREHPSVRKAVDFISHGLERPINPQTLAAAVGVTPTHLNRLFHHRYGLTVMQYLRRQRLERARHLLIHSSLPIGVVAAQAGLPDPHHFNKLIRSTYGMPPRELRRAAR